MAKRFALLCGAISLCAAGCAEISYPDLYGIGPGTTSVRAYASDDEARAYIAKTRKNMVEQRQLLGATEFGTDAMIGAGAIGGLMGGALHWAGSSIIRLATLSGTGAVLSDTFAPRTQLYVLDRGISAIDCVAKQAPIGFAEAADVGAALEGVDDALATLQADLKRYPRASDEVTADATRAFTRARSFSAKHRPQIYEQVRLVSDVIITATNTLMRKAVADPKAFTAEIKNMKIATVGTTPATAPKVTADMVPAADKPGDQQLVYDMRQLQNAIDAATSVIQEKQQASGAGDLFASCRLDVEALSLADSKPVTLKAGDKFEFSVSGPVRGWHWKGNVPNNITVAALSSNEYRVEVASGAAAGTNILVFVSVNDASLDVPVTIQASGH